MSGNCSLYNETNGEAILPTPAIGGVGLIKDVSRMASVALKRAGDAVLLIGETKGHLGQSLYLREIEGREEGAAPPVDLAAEKKNGDFVRRLIEQGAPIRCTIFPTAELWSRSPKWRWRAASAWNWRFR